VSSGCNAGQQFSLNVKIQQKGAGIGENDRIDQLGPENLSINCQKMVKIALIK